MNNFPLFDQVCDVSEADQSSCRHSAKRSNVGNKKVLPAAALCRHHYSVFVEGSHGQTALLSGKFENDEDLGLN